MKTLVTERDESRAQAAEALVPSALQKFLNSGGLMRADAADWQRGGIIVMGCYDGEYWVSASPYKRGHLRSIIRTRDYGQAVEAFENALHGKSSPQA